MGCLWCPIVGAPEAPHSGGLESAAMGGNKKNNWEETEEITLNGFKNLTRAMRITNMCLVLKLDNGKVVSIAVERQTKSQSNPVPY